jgi:hypothetical protein
MTADGGWTADGRLRSGQRTVVGRAFQPVGGEADSQAVAGRVFQEIWQVTRDDKALSHQKKVIFFSTDRSVEKENFRV